MYTRPFREYKPTIHLREDDINAQPSIQSMNSIRSDAAPAQPSKPTTRTPINTPAARKAATRQLMRTDAVRVDRSDEFCIEMARQANARIRRKLLAERHGLSMGQLNYCIEKGRALNAS